MTHNPNSHGRGTIETFPEPQFQVSPVSEKDLATSPPRDLGASLTPFLGWLSGHMGGSPVAPTSVLAPGLLQVNIFGRNSAWEGLLRCHRQGLWVQEV